MAEHSFGNLDNVEASGSYEPIPPGVYTLRSVEQEMRDTKSGTGSFLAVQFEVVDGDFEGRRVFQNFNLVNANSQAVEIALREIKSWLAACGQPCGGELTMSKINALEGARFRAKVGIEKDKSGQYEDRNKIARFIESDGAASSPPAAPVADAPPSGASKKPWE